MDGNIHLLRSYRATLVPEGTPADQLEVKADEGTLPTIQVKARNTARAEAAAHHLTGRPIFRIERIEEQVAA
ncbi:hypothetical protein ASF94_04420 [Acidovorax sp. Leaf160]|nr:hypothetical protein ASF94_04420 [Acidovorax sp. Leaf160]